ncbi:glutamate receptor-like [Colletes latitarsis]|uniref:glutamate receptor-like n=1 Tax=Colletes latitarsis TaxID=2605962 RepID=UPI0040361480
MAQRFVCYATVALLLLSFVSAYPVNLNDIYNYIFLITDVYNYYGTSCITIVHSDKYTKWYSLSKNITRVSNLAVWKPGGKFNLTTNSSLYTRRSNMYGQVMRIAYVKASPFVAMKDGALTHFFGAVMQELSKSMNFTVKVMGTSAVYGNWNEEKKIWTGVIGEVVSRVVDFGIAEFSMSNHRLDVVDFTLPLILSRNKVYFQKPDASSVQWSAYFKTFKMDIWMAIIFTIVSAPILLTLMKTRGRIVMKIIADNYIKVWGIFCQQGMSEFPNESSLRLAFLSIFLSALIILSAYSASLISFLTVSTVALPFSTLEEFACHGSYKLIAFKNSADYDMIISANDSVSLRLKRLLKKKQDLPMTVFDAFQQVCSEKVGFYVTEVIQNAMDRVPCEIVYIEAGKLDSLALVLNKGSSYTGLINYQLQRFKDNGVLNKLKNTFLVTTSSREGGYPVVTLGGVAPILSVLAGGVILGCFILAFEKIYYTFSESKYGESLKFRPILEETARARLGLKSNRKRETSLKSRELNTYISN